MATQLQQWKSEHRNFACLLNLMDLQIKRFRKGERPDYELMHDIMYYMTHYPDRYHHPFEDIVFNRLAERNQRARDAVDELLDEHHRLADSGLRLVHDLEGIVSDAILPRVTVEEDAVAYTEAMRAHMRREEETLFPLIEKELTDEDWAAMQQALESVEDPLFGATVGDKYRSLHNQIAAHAANDSFAEQEGPEKDH